MLALVISVVLVDFVHCAHSLALRVIRCAQTDWPIRCALKSGGVLNRVQLFDGITFSITSSFALIQCVAHYDQIKPIHTVRATRRRLARLCVLSTCHFGPHYATRSVGRLPPPPPNGSNPRVTT